MGTSLGACELNHGYESVFLFIKFMREVKVTTIFYWRIKHGLFPSVCIGDHHESILECYTIQYSKSVQLLHLVMHLFCFGK